MDVSVEMQLAQSWLAWSRVGSGPWRRRRLSDGAGCVQDALDAGDNFEFQCSRSRTGSTTALQSHGPLGSTTLAVARESCYFLHHQYLITSYQVRQFAALPASTSVWLSMLWGVGRPPSQFTSVLSRICLLPSTRVTSNFCLASISHPVVHHRCANALALARAPSPVQQRNTMNSASEHVSPIPTKESPSQSDPLSPPSRHPQRSQPYLTPEILLIIDNVFTMPAENVPEEILNSLHGQNVIRELKDAHQVRRHAEGMLASQHPQRAIRVLALAHRLGCHLRKDIYENIARCMAERKHWQLIPPLVRLARRQMGRLNTRLLNWLARSFTETSQFSLLDEVLPRFEEDGIQPNQRTYHLLISGYIRNHDLEAATTILQRMQEAGFSTDGHTQAAVVSAYRSLGSDPFVQTESLESLRHANNKTSTIIVNALLQLAVDADDPENVLLFTQLFDPERLQIPHTFRIGRTIVGRNANHVPLNHRPRSSPSKQLHLPSLSSPIEPDAASFTVLINYMARRQDILSASVLMEQMIHTGVPPDSRVAAALMRIYFAMGDYASAVQIFAQACDDYPAALQVLSNIAFLPAAARSLIWTELHPSTELGNVLVQGLSALSGLSGMRLALRVMQACDLLPDSDTVHAVISYLNQVENQPPGDILRTLRALLYSLDQPALKHLHVVLRSILQRERAPVSRSGWNQTPLPFPRTLKVTSGDTAFDPTAGIFIKKYRNLLESILSSFISRNVRSDRVMVSLRIHHEAVANQDLDAAKEVFQFMLDRGMHPNKYHYSALMQGYAQVGNVTGARSILDSAVKAGVRPTAAHFTILINGYANLRDPEAAFETFEEMVTHEIAPDVASIDALVGAYFNNRQIHKAKTILLELWSSVAPFPHDLTAATLKHLVKTFRALDVSSRTVHRLSKQQTRLLRWKLRKITRLKVWQKKSVRAVDEDEEVREATGQKELSRSGPDGASQTVNVSPSTTKYNSH